MTEPDGESGGEDVGELRRQMRVVTSGVLGMRGDVELARIVATLAAGTGFPFAAVSIVDRSRLWLAAAYGFDPREFDRPDSFCDAAIKVPGFAPLCVEDAWREPRFQFAPAVLEMNVRAYYAAPLVTSDGYALGTLCLLDQRPRAIDETGLGLLTSLAGNAAEIIECEPNARAYAEAAIAELCDRIRAAAAKQDDAQVTLLDRELKRLEQKLEQGWHDQKT